ncbi:MAG: hypothetical protein JNL38_24735 [Myxococcales bacterium]|nr:hypothetical protein [Myxococcales bacterium]
MATLSIKSLLALGLLSSLAVVGCAADAGDDDVEDEGVSAEEALKTTVAPGEWKLYTEARVTPSAFCDIHTVLSLDNDKGAHARLVEAVSGNCKIAVFPNQRAYRLKLSGTSCGSKIYTGSRRADGKRHTITVTDHRTRTCKDIVPARIIVQEDGVTKYSYDGAPAPKTSTWLTIAPKQCGTNPWAGAKPAAGKEPSILSGELGEIDNFFRAQGVELEQVGLLEWTPARMVCMACSCPRGDTLVVKTKSSADAAKLVATYKFAELSGARATGPKQCGTNPWEAGKPGAADEEQKLATWLDGQGADVTAAGFLQRTEPVIVCMACSCPRGDTAVVTPKDATSAAKLDGLGWSTLQ